MWRHAVLAVVAVSFAACGEKPVGGVEDSLAVSSAGAKVKTALPWTFTTSPYATQNITAPIAGVNVFPFQVGSTDRTDALLTRFTFALMGTVPAGALSNVQLVYFPDGIKKPGVVVATNGGATWAPGATTGTLELILSTPIAVKKGFTGSFALFADVGGANTYFFQTRLQTATVSVGGVEKYVDGYMTCDLPLDGNQFFVTAPASLPWTFTTAPYAQQTLTAPVSGVNVLPFQVGSTDTTDALLTRLAFVLMGTEPLGSITNAQLVYYPNGTTNPGTLIASNGGGTVDPTAGALELVLSSPILVQRGFSGSFALFVDVGGTPPYFFQLRLQTATVSVGGVEKYVDGYMTCDLPMNGDQFNVQ